MESLTEFYWLMDPFKRERYRLASLTMGHVLEANISLEAANSPCRWIRADLVADYIKEVTDEASEKVRESGSERSRISGDITTKH